MGYYDEAVMMALRLGRWGRRERRADIRGTVVIALIVLGILAFL